VRRAAPAARADDDDDDAVAAAAAARRHATRPGTRGATTAAAAAIRCGAGAVATECQDGADDGAPPFPMNRSHPSMDAAARGLSHGNRQEENVASGVRNDQ